MTFGVNLNNKDNLHLKVNHSLKDPLTGAQTNAIESSWRAAKAKVSLSRRKKYNIPGNLARYVV